MSKINNVAEFLNRLSNLGKKKYAFRGEIEIFSKPCMPSIFRSEKYSRDKELEIKIIEKYKTKGDDKIRNSLRLAMEIQHGGFPSRLLDISFNSLIALHFAVTPHFKYNVEASDGKDGIVYVINCERLNSPNAAHLNEIFEYSLNKEKILPLDSYRHYIIDHSWINERIRAQSGAFILFVGNKYIDIEDIVVDRIIIDKKAKLKIRQELYTLFGIDNGFVYPEDDHLIDRYLDDVDYYMDGKFEGNEKKRLEELIVHINHSVFSKRILGAKIDIIAVDSNIEKINTDIENIEEELEKNATQKKYLEFTNGGKSTKKNKSDFILKMKDIYNHKKKDIIIGLIEKTLMVKTDFHKSIHLSNLTSDEKKELEDQFEYQFKEIVSRIEEEIIRKYYPIVNFNGDFFEEFDLVVSKRLEAEE